MTQKYNFKITYKGRTLAKSQTLNSINKRFNEIDKYLSNPQITVNGFGIKNYERNELKIEEIR